MKQFNALKQTLLCLAAFMGISLQAFALSGTYTIGPNVSDNYPDLASAVADLNLNGVTGPVTFNIQTGAYVGTGWQAMITSYPGMSSANPVTFQPASGVKGSVSISYAGTTSAPYVLGLNNASYVRVYNLTMINTSTSAASVINILGSSSYDSLAGNTFTSAVVSSSSNLHAVVAFGVMGTYSGTNVSFKTDTLNNGSASFYLNGVSGSPITNTLLDGNYCNGAYTYGIYSFYANNMVARNNNIKSTSTGFNTVIYTGYAYNGLDISNNTATITTTTPTVYTIYNSNVNSTSATVPANFSNNNISVTTTTGGSYNLYNKDCTNMNFTNNTISNTITSSGTGYAPYMAYGGSNITATGNTFTTNTSTGGIGTGQYYFIYNSSSSNIMNVVVRNNVFNLAANGQIGNTSYYYMYYPVNCTVNKNQWNVTQNNSSGSVYGFLGGGYYLAYYASNTTLDSNKWTLNYPNGNNGTTYGLGYYGWFYGTDNSSSVDTFNVNLYSGGGSFYGLGVYSAYYTTNWKENNWVGNINAGGFYGYVYCPYYTTGYQCTNVQCNNQTWNLTSNSSGYFYSPYLVNYYCNNCTFNSNSWTATSSTGASFYTPGYLTYYGNGCTSNSNTFNVNSTGGIYSPYIMSYYCTNSNTNNNTFNLTGNSSNTTYAPYYVQYNGSGCNIKNNTINATSNTSRYYYTYYLNYGSTDTVENNTFNLGTNGGYIYLYNYYPNAYTHANTWNLTNTTGWNYFYLYYPQGGLFHNNVINSTTTSGGIYGVYGVSSSGMSGLSLVGNRWNLKSTSGGTIYAYANAGYDGGANYYSNIFNTNTSGTSYLFYDPYGFQADQGFFNNTFHSNATTPANNYFIYKTGTPGYASKCIFYNNIFSSTGNVATNPVYMGDTNHVISDYNLYYAPNSFNFQSYNPSFTTASTNLQAWRAKTNREKNSLIYDPGYVNAANGDFHPAANNPNAWSVNGRGKLVPGDTLDLDNNARPKTRDLGVNDLGAYQFTPTSTPPACVATPAVPQSGGNQVFTFGQDTAAVIQWGSSVPASATMYQYPGQQAGAPMPGLVGRSYLWLDLNVPGTTYAYNHTPVIYYKDDQLGNISSEANAKFANRVPGSIWVGYNFTNSIIDPVMNYSYKATPLDSTGSYTIVENARIGIRCVVEPTGVTASNITATSVDLGWDPVFLPIGYQVIVDNIPGTPASGAGALFTSTNSLSVATLTEGTDYYAHVRSICGVKDTSSWTTIKFHTLITCHTPVVKVTALTTTRAVVYWDTVETADHYEYVIQNDPTPEPTFGTVTSKNTMIIPIEAGKPYYVFVRAFCNSIYPQSDWGMGSFIKFPTSVSTINGNGIGLSAYPNPVTDVLHVELANKIDGDATLTVIDITGKVVRTTTVTSNTFEVNMAGLPSGVYQLKYADRSHADVMKVSKQ